MVRRLGARSDRHTRERVFKPKPCYGLRNDFRSLICPTALRVVESLGRCTVDQDTFDELSSLVARLLARIAASVPAAHPDPCATPNVLPLPRPTPDDGPLREGHGASVNLHAAVDYEQCSCDGGNDSCCSDDGLDNGAADAETWRPFGHGDDTEGDEHCYAHADYEDAGCELSDAGCELSDAVAAYVAERVFAQGTSPPSSVFSGDSDMDAVLRCAAIASPIAELMEDGTAGDRHVCQRSPALHSDSGSRTSFDTDMDALLGALQATPSPVFVRPPTPSGTPAQEGAAFDRWFRSLCRTRLPGEVPVPMTDVAMEHDLDAVQPSAVVPQQLSAPATHAVCSDDVDMGAGLATAGNDGAVPVDGCGAHTGRGVCDRTFFGGAHSATATHAVCSDDVDMAAGLAAAGNDGAVPADGCGANTGRGVCDRTFFFGGARRAPTPPGTPALEDGTFDQWCRSQCATPLPGEVRVPVANVATGLVQCTLQSTIVDPPCLQPTLGNRTVCSGDVDMGMGFGTTDNGVLPLRPGLVGDVDKCFRRAAVSRR